MIIGTKDRLLGAAAPRARGPALLITAAALAALLVWAGPAGAACTIPTTLGVAFSIDDSGSMSESDPTLLRSAATGAGIDQLPDGSYAAVSSFDSGARSLVDPIVVTPANRPALKTDIENSLAASGNTYYDLAFEKAKEQLDGMPGTDKRALVFLSDGAPNGGDYMSELETIRQAGIPVFAIGFFSAPGSVLASIAATTGGQAYTVQSPGEAQAVFARIVSTLTCDATQVQESVTLNPGETRGFPYRINPTDREFRALAAWSFGGVTVRLRRPDGSFLSPGAEIAGERFISEETYASVTGRNPAIGGWELQVTAAADNVDQVDVTVDIFRRTSADPPDPAALIAPAPNAQVALGSTVTFQWEGARQADSYEVEINDRVVASGLGSTATSASINLLGAGGPNAWRVAAINQFGKTYSERRTFLRTGYKYVALGDSFSSGEGIEEFFEPKNDCHRSEEAYSTLIDRPIAPGLRGQSIYGTRAQPDVEWGFQACSGATTNAITEAPHGGDPLSQLERERGKDTPQINANDLPVDENTDLVTITVGGNDLQFVSILQICALSKDCTKKKLANPCVGKETELALFLRCLRDQLSPRLDAIYARIHQNAPGARILVPGYPQLFPKSNDEQNCLKLKQQLVDPRYGTTIGFSHTEQNYLRQAVSEANQLIAARVAASGVAQFVPVDGYFAGHEICGDSGEWINAVSLSRNPKKLFINDQSFHPTDEGQLYGYAAAVNDTLHPGSLPGLRFDSAAPTIVRAEADGSVTLSRRKVACPAGSAACTVTTIASASLSRSGAVAAATKKMTRIGGSRLKVKQKRTTTVRFALTKRGLRALKRRKRLKTTVRVVITRDRRVQSKNVTVMVSAPKRRSR